MCEYKKKALLYPYDITNMHFLLYPNLIKNYEITQVASPIGWGYCNEDAGFKFGIYTGKRVCSDIEQALDSVDILIITESILDLPNEHFCEIVKVAKNKRVEIKAVRNSLNCVETEEFIKKDYVEFNDKIIPKNYKLRELPVPLVVVIGSGKRCNKFEIQLELRKIFFEEKYKVTQIGSKNYSEIYGFHSFPNFVYDNTMSFSDKVINFNRYMNYLASIEKPDVFILGVPGGLYPYDDTFHNDFGFINYVVSNAISSDFTILAALNVDHKEKFAESMITSLKGRFDYDVDCIFISNTAINWIETKSLNTLTYLTLPKNKVIYENNESDFYNIFENKSKTRLKNKVISTLNGYSNVDEL